jgi:hypothetical protein
MSCPTCGRKVPDTEPRCPRCGKVLLPIDGPPGVTLHYTGSRYAIGQDEGYYGIWDLIARGGSVERFAKNAKGWSEAWAAYTSLEKGYRRTSMSLDHRADAPAELPPRRAGRILVVLGGVAVGISVMLPWVRGLGGHGALFGVHISVFARSISPAMALPIIGALATLGAMVAPKHVGVLGISLGMLSVGLAAAVFAGPLHGLSTVHGISDIGTGLYAALGGGVLAILGGAVSR